MIRKTLLMLLVALAVLCAFDNSLNGPIGPSSTPQDAAPDDLTVGGRHIRIGDSLDTVLGRFGDATELLASEYGFTWYIYADDYQSYIQIGIADDRVVALYTNASDLQFLGIGVGSTMDEVNLLLEAPLDGITKGNIRYLQSPEIEGKVQRGLYLYDHQYVTFFYDSFQDTTVTSIQIIDEDTELALGGRFGTPSDALQYSYERQNFYATNAIRVRFGLSPCTWHSGAAEVARAHSRDMAERGYFAHKTPEGLTAMDRAHAAGLRPKSIAENLAYGAQNGISMLEMLLNSEGHRKNILGDYEHLGVGVWFGDKSAPYLTQNYLNF